MARVGINLLGEALARDRSAAHLRQVDVAGGACSPAAISAIEIGRNLPTVPILDAITATLGKEPGYYYPLLLVVQPHERALLELARSARRLGHHDIALAAAGKAVGLATRKRPANHQARVEALIEMGHVLAAQARDSLAERVWRKAAEFGARKRVWLAVARAWYWVGRIAIERAAWTEAYHHLLAAAHHLQMAEADDPRLRLRVYRTLARTCGELELLDDAIAAYEQALQVAIELDDTTARAACKMGLGATYTLRGHAEPAIRHLNRAMRCFEDLDDHARIADVHVNLSVAYRLLGHAAERRDHLERALQLHEDGLGDADSRGYLLNESARCAAETGDDEVARRYALRALELLHQPTQVAERAAVYRLLGTLDRRKGSRQTAVRWLEKSLALLENTPHHAERAATLVELADLWQGSGSADKALDALRLGVDACLKVTAAASR